MSTDLQSLYQELILDHYRRPRNWGRLDVPDRTAEGYNPLCGDRVTVHLTLAGDRVRDVRVQGTGCAISVASASLMSEAVKGKTIAEARHMFHEFHKLVTGHLHTNGERPSLGKLAVFAGVARFPARVKCATLAWHALHSALQGQPDAVSTE